MPSAEFFKQLKQTLPTDVTLVAVSKTKPKEDISELYALGQRDFGENKVQELVKKQVQLPKDIRWHAIGHLQRNKVKYIVPFVHLIHAVDSLRLLKEIDKQASKLNRVVDYLFQIHIAQEDTKFGLSKEELIETLTQEETSQFKNTRICGLMGMATNTDNEVQVKKEFYDLKALFEGVKKEFFAEMDYFKELSMGMSGDYEFAIEEGSTMLRIGSKLFGKR